MNTTSESEAEILLSRKCDRLVVAISNINWMLNSQLSGKANGPAIETLKQYVTRVVAEIESGEL